VTWQAGHVPKSGPRTSSRYLVTGLGIVACCLVAVAFATTPSNQLPAQAFDRTIAIAGAGSALAVATVVIAAILAVRRADAVRQVTTLLASLGFAAVALVGSAVVVVRLMSQPSGN
jgi:hypothetical protein